MNEDGQKKNKRTLPPTEFRKTGSFARDFSRGEVLLLGTLTERLCFSFNRKLLETSTRRQQGGVAFAKVFNRDIVL